jgi:hypothetical protein
VNIQDEKRQLVNYLRSHAITEDRFDDAVKTLRISVEPKYLNRWKKLFYSAEKDFQYPQTPRLINRFMLGADPEFLMCMNNRMDSRTEYSFAEDLNLTTLGCFGCDMSGRQAELRAYPSRFALDVVASILETLRWMAFSNQTARILNWQSVAFIAASGREDGFGGHIHFGRKRNDFNGVLNALDTVTHGLVKSGILDTEGHALRQKRTLYGKPSDYREQSHGFEYRSMPTWMHSPQAAHLVMTIVKICVIDKKLAFYIAQPDVKQQKEVILNALRNLRYADDDARIAMRAIELHGWPLFKQHFDFKDAWGVSNELGDPLTEAYFFPSMIKASQETTNQLFDYLVRGQRIPCLPPKVTWPKAILPEGFHKVTVKPHVMGIPEIAQGLVSYKSKVHLIEKGGNTLWFKVGQINFPSKDQLTKAKAKFQTLQHVNIVVNMCPELENYIHISSPENLWLGEDGCNKEMAQDIKTFLCKSGLFPIADYRELESLNGFEMKGEKHLEVKRLGRMIKLHKGEDL